MSEFFHLSGNPDDPIVEVVRKKARRSLSIKLYPYKPIQVLTNMTTSLAVIQKFVFEKQDWIEKHLKKFEEKIGPQVRLSFESGKLYPYLGIWRELKIYTSMRAKIYFEMHPAEMRLFLPRHLDVHRDFEKIQRQLHHFYKQAALELLPKRVQLWSERIGLKPSRLEFRRPRGRWGSCSSRGVVTLNWKLICLPESLVDYVIAHELCHLRHMNHSAQFWAMLDQYILDRKMREDRLDELQFVTDFLESSEG